MFRSVLVSNCIISGGTLSHGTLSDLDLEQLSFVGKWAVDNVFTCGFSLGLRGCKQRYAIIPVDVSKDLSFYL